MWPNSYKNVTKQYETAVRSNLQKKFLMENFIFYAVFAGKISPF